MKVEITKKVKEAVDIKTLEVHAGVRCCEDATVNGVDDEMGDLMPFLGGNYWFPVIDVEKGVVLDWPKGTVASVHYKVCDDGNYYLRDENDNVLLSIESNYVPKIMCPKENGYGDYIIMDIDENGQIEDWEFTLEGFMEEEE